ncbi:MAG TPA: hypothetical protein VGH23_14740 [Rhizomicrobium sp.]
MSKSADAQIRHSEIIWKVVDARCAQLSDAVLAARTPFLLALAWSFAMGWQFYVGNFGYVSQLRDMNIGRLENIYSMDEDQVANACLYADAQRYMAGH